MNLTAPHKTILVNIVKGACGVAVARGFRELCRYNIRTLALSEEEREAQRAAQQLATGTAGSKPRTGKEPAAAAAAEAQQEQKAEQTADEGGEAAGGKEEQAAAVPAAEAT